MKIFFSTLFILTITLSFAQEADEELAAQYFLNEEYDKAEILYKKLFKKNDESIYIYQNYLECLLKQNNLDDAEKMVAKQVKRYSDRPTYFVDLGHIYGLQGKEREKEKFFEEGIKEATDRVTNSLSAPISQIEQLSSAFLKRNEFVYAKSSLLKARKSIGLPTLFAQNLIDIYKVTKEYELLIDECLLSLKYDESSIDAMKSNLIFIVDADIKMDYLQEKSAVYSQKFPEKLVFDELLLWVFVQQKKFNSALRQATAMDKRSKSEGKNLIDLAAICMSNKDYSTALKCYDQIVSFGSDGYFFINAKMGSLQTSYLLVTEKSDYDSSALFDLTNRYTEMISKFGKNQQTAASIKQLSDIYIYYIHDVNKGVALLEELVEMPRLQGKQRGMYKLALGDAMLMLGEIWDATLLYGQVDKEFKEDALGQEAKFRNARLSYFNGDFDWAKDQLDVLKTATSQLISNNAIELSLLIKDNTGLDSSTDALKAFSSAQLLLFQNKLDESLEALNLLPFKYPKHALEDEIYFTKAQIFEKKKDYGKAEEYYNNVVKYFGDDILADNALFALGLLYENQLNNVKKAVEAYEKIILEYNSSLFVVDARKRYKRLLPLLDDTDSTP